MLTGGNSGSKSLVSDVEGGGTQYLDFDEFQKSSTGLLLMFTQTKKLVKLSRPVSSQVPCLLARKASPVLQCASDELAVLPPP
jgi:hypothetical protein